VIHEHGVGRHGRERSHCAQRDLANVIITPHVSAASPGSMQRTAIIAAENLRRYVDGGNLLNVVDMNAGY
jgi:phosphoglycerate dehydrogenase-like enzyme